MSSLYEISTEYKALSDIANNEEFDSETGELIDNSTTLTVLFEELDDTLSNKLDGAGFVIRNIEFENSQTIGEVEYLTKILNEKKAKIKAKENKVKFLKGLMSIAVRASGEKKVTTSKFVFNRIVKKDFSLSIANEDNISREYMRIKKEPKKAEIKKALKSGILIEGCSLSDSVSFTIKG